MNIFVFFRQAMGTEETVVISATNETQAKEIFHQLCEKIANCKLDSTEYMEGFKIFGGTTEAGVVMVSPYFKPNPELWRVGSEMQDVIVDGMKKGILTGEFA